VRICLPDGRDATVDDTDAGLVSGLRWHGCGSAARYVGAFVLKDGRRRRLYLHRLIAGAPPGVHVDHRDGDPLNNRRDNLRLVDRSQNLQNRRGAERRSRTGMRNVTWVPDRRRFRVRVVVAGRPISCGYYGTLEAAVDAAAEARRRFMTHAKECSN
jgi:hypothetical protein